MRNAQQWVQTAIGVWVVAFIVLYIWYIFGGVETSRSTLPWFVGGMLGAGIVLTGMLLIVRGNSMATTIDRMDDMAGQSTGGKIKLGTMLAGMLMVLLGAVITGVSILRTV